MGHLRISFQEKLSLKSIGCESKKRCAILVSIINGEKHIIHLDNHKPAILMRIIRVFVLENTHH